MAWPAIPRTMRRAGRIRLGLASIDRIVAVCGMIPYALVALVLRLVVARDFFLSGQAKAVGPAVPLSFQDSVFP